MGITQAILDSIEKFCEWFPSKNIGNIPLSYPRICA
jgi:hypothetical protein